jgi:ribonuclease HI
MGKQKFYVVWEGRSRGVFHDWATCLKAVQGYQGAKFKSFESLHEAQEAFRRSAGDYISRKPAAKKPLAAGVAPPLKNALSVDAACKGNPGVMEYRGVWVHDGVEYFRMGPYPEGTVNIGEFLAIVHGLALLKKDQIDLPVYSDSMTAIKWVRDKKANTKLEENALNSKLFEYIDRAEQWLRNNQYSNVIMKWNTAAWGEIPADYGRK